MPLGIDPAALLQRAVRNTQIRMLLIRVVSVAASFLVISLLARFAGPATVGEYGFAVVTATTLSYVCMLGLDQLVLRAVPAALVAGDSGRARLMARAFVGRIGIASMVVAAIFLLGFPLLPSLRFEEHRGIYRATAALVLVYPLLRFSHGLLRAAGMPLVSQIVESLSATSMALIIVLLLVLGVTPGAQFVVSSLVVISAVLLALSGFFYSRASAGWSHGAAVAAVPRFDAGLSFMLITVVHASTEWFALYALLAGSDAEELGVFRVVFQVAALLALVVQTGQNYVAPLIAADLNGKDPARALRRYRQSRRIMILLAAVPTVALLVAPERFLDFAFGPEFRSGALALTVLVISQFINVATGPVGAVLAMAGRERVLLVIAVVAMVMVVVLSWWLVPLIGLMGTAIALAASTVLRNLASYWFARQVFAGAGAAAAVDAGVGGGVEGRG